MGMTGRSTWFLRYDFASCEEESEGDARHAWAAHRGRLMLASREDERATLFSLAAVFATHQKAHHHALTDGRAPHSIIRENHGSILILRAQREETAVTGPKEAVL